MGGRKASRVRFWVGMMFLNRTRQIIGLDIGSHAIKMVALRPAKGELPFELTHFGVAELPEETIVDGAIVNEDPVVETIAELFEQHKIKSPFVAASVSGNAVIVRRVTLPRQDPEDLREALPYEAEEHIPFDIDDVDLDFAILSEDEDSDSMDVVLVAAKRERVDEHVAVIEEAKRTATIMDIDAFAVQNAFEFSYPERQFEDIAILNLGASVINMAVLEGGNPSFWRDIAIGMQQYVIALQRQFMLDAFDAEEVLRRVSRGEGGAGTAGSLAEWSADGEEGADLQDAAADPRVIEVIGQVSDRIIGEIVKTFDFYQAQAMRDHFDAVFLAGGGAHVNDLAERLRDRLGWPVETLDPLRRVAVPESQFDPEYVHGSAPESTVALGLALRGVME
ncbi:MAG: type IV pilus assembly protein PilM [Acidobacteria bacterium]|nr:type IV pilus assembly protein PilM [Acidobacteriota bacterium]